MDSVNTTGPHTVTAALQGDPRSINTIFDDITAVDASRSASLVLVSGDNQQSSDAATHDVEDSLVVRVRRPGGYRIAGVHNQVHRTQRRALSRSWNRFNPRDSDDALIGTEGGQEIYVLNQCPRRSGGRLQLRSTCGREDG